MRPTARTALASYLGRRTPTGVPWWIYGATILVVNGVRQLVLWRLDAGSEARIASFVVMLLLIVAVIEGTARLLRRQARAAARATAPFRPC